MNPAETPKPFFSRLASYLMVVFASSTLNPFPQAFSSSVHENPEPTPHGGSDMGIPPESTLQGSSESESVQANKEELAVVTNSIPSASAIPYGEQDTLSSSSLFRHSQINSIPSSSSPTNHRHDSGSPNTNSQNLHSAEAERREHGMVIIDEQPAETTSRRRDHLFRGIDIMDASIPSYPSPSSSAIFSQEEGIVSPPPSTENSLQGAETISRRDPDNSLDVMEIIDQQDLAKHILGLAIPMAVALIFSTSKLAKTTELRVVVIALSFAIDAIWIGLLLRKTYRKTSTALLTLGIALMLLAFYGFLGCFLPSRFKWIPALCWLASLIPLAMHGWVHFRRNKVADAERGEF